jgi:capsular exopolysaccharide synthesis family protein
MKQNYTKEINSLELKKTGLIEDIKKYIFHWKWFALGLFISLLLSFLYLRYTTPQYNVVSTILINHKQNESVSSELSAFADLSLIGNNKSQFDTEIGILKSKSLMESVVKKLRLNEIYYAEGRLKNTELYSTNLSFRLNFFDKDLMVYRKDTTISIVPESQTKFNLLDANDILTGSYKFGENISSEISNFTVTPTTATPIKVGLKVIIKIVNTYSITNAYRKKIRVEPIDRKSSLINISLTDQNKLKAETILKVLVEEYNKQAIINKSLIAQKTDVFINERIEAISKELTEVDIASEDFKTTNNLIDIESETSIILKSNNELEKETLDIRTQLKMVDYMSEHITSEKHELVPTNLGLTSNSLNESTISYNKILLERNRLLISSNTRNPIILNLKDQLTNLKTSISQSLVNLKSSLSISLNYLKKQQNKLNSKITSVPRQVRALKDIKRQEQIVETLYLYLLEKREENAIALAIKAPNAKVIDYPFGSSKPVSPNNLNTYIIAAALGLIIPFIIFSLLFLFDNKIHSIEDLESSIDATVLGDVPKLTMKKSKNIVISNNDGSPFTEAFKIIRTNIYFILSKNKKPCKTIFVSSTISGEGKSFISINLAKVLLVSSKKVLLIGGDIRNPKLADYLNIPTKNGLTHYLADTSFKPETVIEHIPSTGFDIVQGGYVAPNPTELLMNNRFDELLTYAKEKYDYIVVDTAPVSLVTDTILLSENRVDLFVYIVRANYLSKQMLKIPKKLNTTQRIQNMAVVLNATDQNGLHGYGYGYGYGTVIEKNWIKRLFK